MGVGREDGEVENKTNGERMRGRIDTCICVKGPHFAHLEQTNHCNHIGWDKK